MIKVAIVFLLLSQETPTSTIPTVRSLSDRESSAPSFIYRDGIFGMEKVGRISDSKWYEF